LIALWRTNAVSGMKKMTRRSMRIKAPPIACMQMRYEPYWIIDPAKPVSIAIVWFGNVLYLWDLLGSDHKVSCWTCIQ
jgi:hypothetical protein